MIDYSLKVFPVLWHLVCDDVFKVWEICPIFQKCNALHIIIADPIEVPIIITFKILQCCFLCLPSVWALQNYQKSRRPIYGIIFSKKIWPFKFRHPYF